MVNQKQQTKLKHLLVSKKWVYHSKVFSDSAIFLPRIVDVINYGKDSKLVRSHCFLKKSSLRFPQKTKTLFGYALN